MSLWFWFQKKKRNLIQVAASLNLSHEPEVARGVKGLIQPLIKVLSFQPLSKVLPFLQELFAAIDIPKNGFIFLRDVVEILRYIKKDGTCDQVEIHMFYIKSKRYVEGFNSRLT